MGLLFESKKPVLNVKKSVVFLCFGADSSASGSDVEMSDRDVTRKKGMPRERVGKMPSDVKRKP